jgi:uncharacterized protein (TIGR00661 family)
MRFLFIVQGEGRGHLTQAISLADILRRRGHEVSEVLVGKSRSRDIPAFFSEKIKSQVYVYEAPSFIFKKDNKHVDKFKTFIYNCNPQRVSRYVKSIEYIKKRLTVLNPDVVINFYEMLPGFMHLRYRIDIPFINVGHQYMMKHPDYQFAKGDSQNMMFLRLNTLLTNIGATKLLALSFYPMKACSREKITVVPPLLRKEVLDLKPYTGDYILGYMLNTGYYGEVRKWHEKNPDVKLHFFWDKKDAKEELEIDETLTLHKISDEKFLQFMEGCSGYITTAGFESVCEALFLNKTLMLIPAHIEQEINAADAQSINGGFVGKSFNLSLLLEYIENKKPFDHESFKKWALSAEDLFIKELEDVIQK